MRYSDIRSSRWGCAATLIFALIVFGAILAVTAWTFRNW